LGCAHQRLVGRLVEHFLGDPRLAEHPDRTLDSRAEQVLRGSAYLHTVAFRTADAVRERVHQMEPGATLPGLVRGPVHSVVAGFRTAHADQNRIRYRLLCHDLRSTAAYVGHTVAVRGILPLRRAVRSRSEYPAVGGVATRQTRPPVYGVVSGSSPDVIHVAGAPASGPAGVSRAWWGSGSFTPSPVGVSRCGVGSARECVPRLGRCNGTRPATVGQDVGPL